VFHELYDTTLQTPCLPFDDFTTGRAYCIPGASSNVAANPSANCTGPLTSVTMACAGPLVLTTGSVGSSGGCAGIDLLFTTQTTRAAPPLSVDAGGICVSIDTAGKDLWVGPTAPYDPSGLAELALVHD
jgi:hypothetical protein